MYETDLTGRTLGGFRVLGKLGAGGMAAVYRAHEAALDRVVALKVIHPHLAQQPEIVARFEREARAAAQLTHPNIVQIYMVGEEGDLPFFSMEYVNGKTLQSVIETEGFLTARRAVPILRQAAEALAAAHEAGIVHRDIKPSNILLDSAGRVKVTDFGIAQVATESRLTQTGMLLGTPGYISPEQCLGEPLDARTDIYALGVTMYETLAGHMPFQADTPAALVLKIIDPDPQPLGVANPTVPPDLEAIVERMMQRDPAQRFQTAEDILAALSRAEVDVLPMAVVQRRTGRPADALQHRPAPEPDATRVMPASQRVRAGGSVVDEIAGRSEAGHRADRTRVVDEAAAGRGVLAEEPVAGAVSGKAGDDGSTVGKAGLLSMGLRVRGAARPFVERAAARPVLLLPLSAAVGAASAAVVIAAWALLGPPRTTPPPVERAAGADAARAAPGDVGADALQIEDVAVPANEAAPAPGLGAPPPQLEPGLLDASTAAPAGLSIEAADTAGGQVADGAIVAESAASGTDARLDSILGTVPSAAAVAITGPVGLPEGTASSDAVAAAPGDLAVAAAEPNASEPAAATAAAPNEDAAGSGSAIEQPPSELESLLILAAARRERGDLITPDSDSAYAYLERAAALYAGDERVRRARSELGAAVAAAALDLIERGELDQAERARAATADLDVGTRSLDAIERALEAAREARAAERHASLLRSARERLAAGRLVEPDDDSAWFYLSELRRENLAHPELADAWRELITALEDNVRAELGRQDWPQAEARLAELERAEPDSAAARELAKELEISRRQQAYLAVPAPPSELVVLERSPLEYPRYALRYQIEGTVVLEFIVDRGGRAREISVVEAEPPGRFEEAAIAAVEKYRFAPFEVDGHVYERRVRLPVSFKLR